MKRYTLVIGWVLTTGTLGLAQNPAPCPQPPNHLKVKVDASVSYDDEWGFYIYRYTVTNEPSSKQNILQFAVEFAPPITYGSEPKYWDTGDVYNRPIVRWSAARSGPWPRGGVTDPSQLPPILSSIKPGASLSGFSFTSPHPPGPVKYYVSQAEGELNINEEASLAAAHLLPPVGCFLDRAVVGSTQGPVNFIPVQIDIKPPSQLPVSINPQSEGETSVAILGSRSFDVTTVDGPSLRLGPGSAAPMRGKLEFKDVNGDGITDLLARFPTPKIGLRCLDTALFLTGKKKDGKPIRGSEAVHMFGCR